MPSVPRVRRRLSAVLASLALVAAVLIPIGGVASAAGPTCPTSGDLGSCYISISVPDSVLTNQPFAVQVTAYADDGYSTVASGDACASAQVYLGWVEGDNNVYSAPVPMVAGIATFSLTVTQATNYNLYAYFLVAASDQCSTITGTNISGDGVSFTAVYLPPDQPIAPCPDGVVCAQTVSGTGSAATLFADTGTFSAVHFELFAAGTGCEVSGPADPNGVLSFDYSGDSSKTIVLALSSKLVTKGIGLYNICWESINPFTQLGGTQAPFVAAADMYVGYLPACKKDDAGPCVLFKKSNKLNTGFFGIFAPPGDPKVYPK